MPLSSLSAQTLNYPSHAGSSITEPSAKCPYSSRKMRIDTEPDEAPYAVPRVVEYSNPLACALTCGNKDWIPLHHAKSTQRFPLTIGTQHPRERNFVHAIHRLGSGYHNGWSKDIGGDGAGRTNSLNEHPHPRLTSRKQPVSGSLPQPTPTTLRSGKEVCGM